jgi:hypothetical protein
MKRKALMRKWGWKRLRERKSKREREREKRKEGKRKKEMRRMIWKQMEVLLASEVGYWHRPLDRVCCLDLLAALKLSVLGLLIF